MTQRLSSARWQQLAAEHAHRADALTAEYRGARAAGRRHAIDDFLFTYYSYRPSVLRKWHPGIGIALDDADEYADKRWYRTNSDGSVTVDAAAFLADRGHVARQIRALSEAVAGRQPRFSCFGLHEWAMVYRQPEHRHPIPLRLGQAGTDAVVESHDINCTHFDAFRFFTPDARPLNQLQPTRATQCDLDQTGCLHANMDLYKWAMKLGPLVPGDLLLDTFAFAREIRWTDMQASPYDVSGYNVPAIAIETPQGKAEYVQLQRSYAERAQLLRGRLIEVIRAAQQAATTGTEGGSRNILAAGCPTAHPAPKIFR